jgi:hypothetical protein
MSDKPSAPEKAQAAQTHPSGTTFAFCHAGQGAQLRHSYRSRRSQSARWQAAYIFAAFVNLGSRVGNGPAQNIHGGHGSESVLL